MGTFHSIIYFLDGRKSTILAIAALILSYLVSTNVLTAQLGTLLQAILSALTGGAVAAGSTVGYQNYKTVADANVNPPMAGIK